MRVVHVQSAIQHIFQIFSEHAGTIACQLAKLLWKPVTMHENNKLGKHIRQVLHIPTIPHPLPCSGAPMPVDIQGSPRNHDASVRLAPGPSLHWCYKRLFTLSPVANNGPCRVLLPRCAPTQRVRLFLVQPARLNSRSFFLHHTLENLQSPHPSLVGELDELLDKAMPMFHCLHGAQLPAAEQKYSFCRMPQSMHFR